ncbi:MAG: IS3 family transposase [Actinobacteria bacterium]|nr:IS3 family transposase [Actinomycetota bacterium]
MTDAFIEREKADFPVRFACRVLGVSPSGFYEWRARQHQPSQRARDNAALVATIREIHTASRGTYGSPRVHAELRLGRGMRVNRKRVERLMRVANIAGVTRRRRGGCTRRNPQATSSDDLVNRACSPHRPDALWVADVTEHPTGDGKVYLAVMIDAFSRLVVGHSIADHLRTELVLDALDMACCRRKPAASTIHHSDHGTQGEFKRSSQHLESEEWRWERAGVDKVTVLVRRCVRRGVHRWPGENTASGSGVRSPAGCRAKMPPRGRRLAGCWFTLVP